MKRANKENSDDDLYDDASFDIFSEPLEYASAVVSTFWKEFETTETPGIDKELYHVGVDNGQMQSFIDFKASQVYVTAEIVNADGITDVKATEKVSIINNGIGSIFQEILIQYDYKSLMNCANMYNYMSYFLNLLSFGDSSMQSIGAAGLFFPDTPGHFNSTSTANKGFTDRLAITQNKFTVGGQLSLPLCNQDRFFINQGKKLEFIFKIAANDFVLHTDNADGKKYKLLIHKIVLRIKYVMPTPKILKSIRNKLEKGAKAVYLLKRPDCFYNGVSNQTDVHTMEISCQKHLPMHVLLCVCLNSQRTGDPKTSPYCFLGKSKEGGFEIDTVTFQTNERDIITQTLDPDFGGENYTKTYLALYESLGLFRGLSNSDVPILPYKGYANGYCLFSHSLNPDPNDTNMFRVEGTLKISVKFKKIPTVNLNIIVMAVYDSILTIDGTGVVTKSWVV